MTFDGESRPAGLALAAAALVCLCVAVFGQIRHHDFADFDDRRLELADDLEAASLAGATDRAFTGSLLANWMPVTTLSHQLDRALYATTSDPGPDLNVLLKLAKAAANEPAPVRSALPALYG